MQIIINSFETKKNIGENKDAINSHFTMIYNAIINIIERFIQDEFDKLRERILHPEKRLRNGYYERSLVTPFGLIQNIRIPRFRNFKFKSELFEPYQRRLKIVDEIITASHTLGHSYKDIQKIVRLMWNEPSMSLSIISRIKNK